MNTEEKINDKKEAMFLQQEKDKIADFSKKQESWRRIGKVFHNHFPVCGVRIRK